MNLTDLRGLTSSKAKVADINLLSAAGQLAMTEPSLALERFYEGPDRETDRGTPVCHILTNAGQAVLLSGEWTAGFKSALDHSFFAPSKAIHPIWLPFGNLQNRLIPSFRSEHQQVFSLLWSFAHIFFSFLFQPMIFLEPGELYTSASDTKNSLR